MATTNGGVPVDLKAVVQALQELGLDQCEFLRDDDILTLRTRWEEGQSSESGIDPDSEAVVSFFRTYGAQDDVSIYRHDGFVEVIAEVVLD